MPVIHIELKRSGVDVTQATNQIKKNTSDGNGAHASYLLSEQQLDENIKAFSALYPYVTGMCYTAIKGKYEV